MRASSATLRRTRTLSKLSRSAQVGGGLITSQGPMSSGPSPGPSPLPTLNQGFKGVGLREPASEDVCYLELALCQWVTGYGGSATRRSSEVPAPTTMWIKSFRARCGLMVSVLCTLLEIHRLGGDGRKLYRWLGRHLPVPRLSGKSARASHHSH